MTAGEDVDTRLRAAMFRHLERVSVEHPDGIPSKVINSFVFEGRPMKLTAMTGIWKPAILSAALTIRTTYTGDGQERPYDDDFGDDGAMRYKWRGTDPNHSDNLALREAMSRRLPLVYFVPAAEHVYAALFPVYLVEEDVAGQEFSVSLGDDAHPSAAGEAPAPERRYADRLTRQRLHQRMFRPTVLRAYRSMCAVFQLRQLLLLDAAHILGDRHERGEPVVSNGLALCKIHHAAYDANILGIRPDSVVEVRADILRISDKSPMFLHGLRAMHHTGIVVPKAPSQRPDRSRLEERYEQFRSAAAAQESVQESAQEPVQGA